jgi:type I restriction-modification system DNA methylase subunit
LPKNTIGTIIQRQKEVKKLVKTFTLYDSYKVYFEAINEGDEDLDITKYNGGLFAEDELLNTLIIDDEVLDARAKILSAYNFGSDISVNILGHIFENSISELEEMSAQLLDNDFDKKQSKRKKDGVFYTPAYITEYIVQNTLGKLCEEKRAELNITEVEAIANPKKPTKKEQERKENLLTYKEWLLNLKILDPACGSGAFLNQALEYLLKEHKRLQNDLALMGDLFASYEVEKEVLEHNLYGVDINEGAVEIARLSLWLRTAKRGRPLTKLANKIKVGNSLIDDKTVVPNAFDWHAEFPEVFAQGGFDVVIGNPPYVSSKNLDKDYKEYFSEKYVSATSQYDLYTLFIELGILITKMNGCFSYIIPDKFLITDYGKSIRILLIKNTNMIGFKDLSNENIFEDASVYPVIIVLEKIQKLNVLLEESTNLLDYFGFSDTDIIVNKLDSINEVIVLDVWRPIATSKNIIINEEKNIIVSNGDINRYSISENKKGYLDKFREKDISKDKLLIKKLCFNLEASIDEVGYFPVNTTYCIKSHKANLKYVLCCLNSSLLSKYARSKYKQTALQGGYIELRVNQVQKLPIKKISEELERPFIQKADTMLLLNKNLQETKQNFHNELKLEKLTKKLQNFETLTFEEFITEYTKSLKLKFADKLAERNFKQEWQALFENDKTIASALKTEIEQTDKEIDKMVYELYGLSDDEIGIVEGV